MALYIRVKPSGSSYDGVASVLVTFTVVSPPAEGELAPRKSTVALPIKVREGDGVVFDDRACRAPAIGPPRTGRGLRLCAAHKASKTRSRKFLRRAAAGCLNSEQNQ